MNKKAKIWLIIGASLIIIGGIIFCGVMSTFNFDFTKLSTDKYQTNSYDITENFKDIAVLTDTADVTFIMSDDDKITVTCYEQENMKHLVCVRYDTLLISLDDNREWYNYIGINFNSPKITISIPKGEYGELSVDLSTGDVNVPKEFTFKNIDIKGSTGSIKMQSPATQNIKLKTSTGHIFAENITADTVNVSVSTGKVNLKNIKCKNLISSGDTGDVNLENVIADEKFSVTRSTGDVNLKNCDAAQIFIETDTGDVEGNLLSEKIFITNTDTGKISVPKTTSGGKCEITTDTGDIKINISAENTQQSSGIDKILEKTNNTKAYNDSIKTTVNIEDFTNFIKQHTGYFSIEDFNSKYYIECLRKPRSNVLYSVHKTDNDGIIYVFFAGNESEKSYHFICWYYVEKNLTYKDFKSIKNGVSTIEDVEKIDPAASVHKKLIDNSTLRFEHYLSNGIMQVLYKKENGKFLVDKIELSKKFISDSVGYSDGSGFEAKILDIDFIK